jgi:predicted metal-dependent phosphoesterase TrpH
VESPYNTGVIDLHTHTLHSDGALSPEELLKKAKAVGIRLISVTDHDSVSGLAEAERWAKELGIGFIPGIEITSSYKRYQLHILGFFVDYTNESFALCLTDLRNARVNRARRIIAKLNRIKIPLKLESVLEKSGVEDSIGRPHIASTMVEEGYAETYDEVFNKYLGIGRPAYEANPPFPPEQAIKMVAEAGGLSFIAHPSHYVGGDILRQLQKFGLDGIEVIHPSHSPEETDWVQNFADDVNLLKCGGSDFHGGLKNDDENFGRYSMEEGWLESMQKKLGRRVLN